MLHGNSHPESISADPARILVWFVGAWGRKKSGRLKAININSSTCGIHRRPKSGMAKNKRTLLHRLVESANCTIVLFIDRPLKLEGLVHLGRLETVTKTPPTPLPENNRVPPNSGPNECWAVSRDDPGVETEAMAAGAYSRVPCDIDGKSPPNEHRGKSCQSK